MNNSQKMDALLSDKKKWVTYPFVALIVGFLVFAFWAPIAGGALATGSVSPDGARRVVQHLEGGIVQDIHIADGDVVEAGELLIELDSTQAKTEYQIANTRVNALLAKQARIEAQRLGRSEIVLGHEYDEPEVPELQTFIERQRLILISNLETEKAKEKQYTDRAAQLRLEIDASYQIISSQQRQLSIINEEIQAAEVLLAKGLYAKPRLLALKREAEGITSRVADARISIASLRAQLSELSAQRLEKNAIRAEELANELEAIDVDLLDAKQVRIRAKDTLQRVQIVAPVSGEIIALQFETIGGVVRPGEPILEIVPNDGNIKIVAQVRPSDIDLVEPGLEARITFSSLVRNLPQIRGTVVKISADTVIDEHTGSQHYVAEVDIPVSVLKELNIFHKISAGMPVEVMITTESRTVFEYLMEPVNQTFRRSFREAG